MIQNAQSISRRLKAVLLLGMALSAASAAVSARAQTTPQDSLAKDKNAKSEDTKDKDATTTVTVKGRKPTSTIDKQIYDVGKDPDSQTGTAVDALNKVPGVVADSDGNVTFRGKAVTIYLNGHPSLMLQGDNRGIALQSMPSGYIGSIEVISNPGAQYGSAGGGGPILNLVTTHAMPSIHNLSLMPKIRSDGGNSLDGSVFIHSDKLTVMAFAGVTQRRVSNRNSGDLQSFGLDGMLTTDTQRSGSSLSRSSTPHLFSNFEYRLDKDNVLSGQLNDFSGHGRSSSSSGVTSYDGTGAATNIYDSRYTGQYSYGGPSLNFNWVHYGRLPDETLKLNAQIADNSNRSYGDGSNTYQLSSLPQNTGVRVTHNESSADKLSGVFNLDYNRPVGDDQLSGGLQVNIDSSRSMSKTYGPDDEGATPTLNDLLTRDFRYQQTISAAYLTWQREIGARWTVLGGLRVEQLDLTTDQKRTGATAHVQDTHLNPSLYATYLLSHNAKLRFNYAHRLQRPTPEDYDTSLNYVSNGLSRGNTHLKAQEINAFEANYEYAHDALSWSIHGFYQQDSRVVTTSSRFIADPGQSGNQVLEITRGNNGSGDSGGVQVTYNNQFWKKLSVTLSATAATDHMRSPAVPGVQSQTALSGNANLSWQVTKKDFLSFRYQQSPRTLTGEGYMSGHTQGYLNYSHNFGKLTLTLDAENLFQTKTLNVTRTPIAHSIAWSQPLKPVFSIGLRRTFNLSAIR